MAEPKAACVIGWPVGHSRSPLIHNYWIKQHGLDAEYRREAVPPEKFADFVSNLRANGYIGANISVPHKEIALKLTEPDDRARAVGAANALWYDDDRLRSTNTDVEGFLANLDAATPGWDRGLSTAVVLGAGGGARAVIFALLAREVGRIYLADAYGGNETWFWGVSFQLTGRKCYGHATSLDDAEAAFWSPDGRFIGFFAGMQLKKIPLSGGAPVHAPSIRLPARQTPAHHPSERPR